MSYNPFNAFSRTRPASVAQLQADRVADADQKRQAGITRRWKLYWGGFTRPLLRTQLDPKAADNTVVNLARRTVDISSFYLFGVASGLDFQVDDGVKNETGKPTDREVKALAYLKDCWKAQEGGQALALLEMATAGGVSGDVWLRVLPPDLTAGEEFPQIIDIDAGNVSVVTDPSNYKRVRQYRVQSSIVDGSGRLTTYRTLFNRVDTPQGPRWEITEKQSNGDDPQFKTISGPTRWQYDFCPIFHCKNRPCPLSFFGTSDLEDDVLSLNDRINFVVSNINRILRAHGHPLQYITGSNVNDVDRAVGSFLKLTNENAKVANVEMLSDLASSFSQLEKLRDAYHELTSIPEVVSGKLESVGQLSGLALQILYGPIVALTETKRLLYGTMLIALCEALLIIGGFDGVMVSLVWPNLLPEDRQAEAATALSLNTAGVSKATLLRQLGFDPEEEAEKSDAEARKAMELQARAFNAGAGSLNENED